MVMLTVPVWQRGEQRHFHRSLSEWSPSPPIWELMRAKPVSAPNTQLDITSDYINPPDNRSRWKSRSLRGALQKIFFGNSSETAMPNTQLDIISIHRTTDQSGHQGHSQSCLKRRRRQKKSCFYPIIIYDINTIFLFLDPPSRCFSRERVANSGIYEMSPFPLWKPQPKPPLLPIYRFPLNKFPIPIPRFSILSFSPANQNTFPCQCPSLLTDTKKTALLPVWSWWEIGCFHREPSSKNLNPQCQKQDLPSQMNYKECKLVCNRKIKCTFKCHF